MNVMGCYMGTIRYVLIVFNLIVVFVGLYGIAVAVTSLSSASDGVPAKEPRIVLIGLGGAVLITALIGCCGAWRKNLCLLTTYSAILLIVFLLKLSVVLFLYCNWGELTENFKQQMELIYEDYNVNQKTNIDTFQTIMECCGSVSSSTPWSTFHMSPPESCYSIPRDDHTAELYSEACVPKMINMMEKTILPLARKSIIRIMIVLMINLLLSLSLVIHIRRSLKTSYRTSGGIIHNVHCLESQEKSAKFGRI